MSPKAFLTAFIPLFVAMDALGILPFYVPMVEGISDGRRKWILKQAILTALAVGIGFILAGKATFSFLGITVSDFKVAGGLILVILSVTDMLYPTRTAAEPSETGGVVPLGVPFIVGPAVLTALIVQVDAVGIVPTILAFIVNLAITYLVFRMSGPLLRVLRKGGTQAIAKVANLLLASYGVMTIRAGITEILAGRM